MFSIQLELNQKIVQQLLLAPGSDYFFGLYSIKKFAYIIFNAPGLFLRINWIAFMLWQPLWTNASATISGARPRPATQWTAILGGPAFPWPFKLNYFLFFSNV